MAKKYSTKSSPKKSQSSRKLLVIGAVVLLVVAILLVTELTNTTHIFHKAPATPAGISTDGSTPSSTSNNNLSNNPATNNESSGPSKSTSPNDASSASLQSPDQSTYVSNHNPSTINDKLQSVCVTSPGATCEMIFKMGAVSKNLKATKTDTYGSVYWAWTPKSLGLTSGKWSITANATLGGQTKTSSDVTPLVVP